MLIYLLKFSACLAVLMIFYKLLLEKSSVHKFKRFYLLGALVVALTIPSLTFIEYIEPVIAEEYTSFVVSDFEIIEDIPQVIEVNYTPIILWSLYGLGVFVFLLKFCINLNNIISRIRNNPKSKAKGFINVLVSSLKIPHTFFNYIFFNKYKFEHNDIPQEVFLHEQTHAKQKHSIDVLLLELIQIIFWFNPLVYLLKREVKLNHEFLADHAVLQNGIEPSTYQTILLAFSSNAHQQELANAINYSSIKKRFTVMNTHTSKRSIWMRSLLILPVLALLFYGFTEREQIERENITPEIIELYLNEEGELLLDDKVITFEDIEALYLEDSKLQVSIKIFPDADVDIAKNISSKLRDIGIKKMMVCTSRVAEFQNYAQEKATDKEVSAYNAWAKKLKEKFKNLPESEKIEGFPVLLNDEEFRYFNSIYDKMSNDQLKAAESIPEAILEVPGLPLRTQEKATAKQVEEYNKLAIKLSALPKKNPIIKLKDIERINQLYKLMSASQKDNAKPFPSFPPPPPPPAPPIKVIKSELTWVLLNSRGQFLVNDKLSTIKDVEAEFKNVANNKKKSKDIVFKHETDSPKDIINKVNVLIANYNLKNIYDTLPPPPPPPAPKSKTGNGPNGSEYYPIPPPIPENATDEQRAAMQVTIDDFEKKYKRKVHQAKMNDGEMISIIANDDVYDPNQDAKKIKSGFINIKNTPHYYVSINNATKYYNREGYEVNKKGQKISDDQVNASDVIPGQYLTKVYSNDKVMVEFFNNNPTEDRTAIVIPTPKVPKDPKSALDFVIDMAKKDAKFHFENKSISSDNAIKLLKNNKDLNLQAIENDAKQYHVFISEEPINTNRGKSDTAVIVNGKTNKNNQYSLSKKDIENLKLTLNDAQIINFKLKIPEIKSEFIKGNSLSSKTKKLINDLSKKTIIQVYDIKDNNGFKHPPIIIEITI
jgi:hypothetical protein